MVLEDSERKGKAQGEAETVLLCPHRRIQDRGAKQKCGSSELREPMFHRRYPPIPAFPSTAKAKV
uniref:Uncharacterized protein n=1 Tax=Anguilla anguilla TaxID=7936 RepID=A0A0E9UFY7_ANGAN